MIHKWITVFFLGPKDAKISHALRYKTANIDLDVKEKGQQFIFQTIASYQHYLLTVYCFSEK